MKKLRSSMAYVCAKYPYKDDLSNARLTKIMYLADWRSAIIRERQITEVEWEFNYFGPYVPDILEIAKSDNAFEVEERNNFFGGKKNVIKFVGENSPNLPLSEVEILDFVISSASAKNWNDFIRLVYSTYPIVTQRKFSKLDLIQLAGEYKKSPAFRDE